MTTGKLIVIEGPLAYYNPGGEDPDCAWIKGKEDWPETNVLIRGAENLASRWSSQSKKNSLFCYKVARHLSKGYDVVLTARRLEYLDKRLRLRTPGVIVGLTDRE